MSAKAGASPESAPDYFDFIFRGGFVIDGTGAPATRADIGIGGDRITAIGDLQHRRARQKIDVRGCILAPGFIDVHTHDDQALLVEPGMKPKVSQGVTTVITGNCGVSLAPLIPKGTMPSTFDLLGNREAFRFSKFDDYIAEFVRRPATVNVGCLVGHSNLRFMEMDDLDRPATEAEIAAMQLKLAHALDAGALGLSTGLYYPASRAAPTEEVIALAKVVGARGGIYATHMRDEADGVEASLEESLRIGREARVPVQISHHKIIGSQNFGLSLRTLTRIDRAQRKQKVTLDVYPYVAGSTILDPQRCDGRMRVLVTWSKSHPAQAGRNLEAIAEEWGCSRMTAAERLLPAGAIYFMLHEDDVRRILAHPSAMIGSDGLPHDDHPHPRLWGTFPRVLGRYARDLGLFSLAEAVRRMTSLPAASFGLVDRGIIRIDAFADLVAFHPDQVIDRATFDDPVQPSDGIKHVMVNGQFVFQEGAVSNARPGRPLLRLDGAISN